ncbi:MAG TPA: hypothetical protein PLD25_29875 [Chloroflexota bacterium]|nr:hypothetical protein [Chloroflexota bacterium]HUM67340.1 hypothetical protein [Chloroflexota bacterium]
MNASLTVADPLADQEVTIIVTLAAGDQLREERPAMVSVGIAEQLPVIKTGIFGELSTLIDEAWTAFGVRAQVAEAATESETVAEEQVIATVSTGDDEPVPTPPPNLSTPKPQVKNLSLF